MPFTSGSRVTGKVVVGLETHLTAERRLDLALVACSAGEESAAELGLDEELGVEDGRGRVEGRARDRRVHEVGGSDGVSGEEPDDLEVLEADVEEAVQNLVDSV